tara:strand:+ start:7938 stop:8873 length:936 start_codon:yes stop_codon:yes gene_type:complete
MSLLSISIINFLILILTFLFYKNYLGNYFLDLPNARSAHSSPVPRGAGIVFSLYSSICTLLSGSYSTVICLPLSIVGFLDDKFSISSKNRYLCQLLTVIVIIYFSSLFQLSFNLFSLLLFLILCVVGTGVINFCNFLDCLDGLLASTSLVVFSTISMEDTTLLPLVFSLSIFLFFNWNPARIFMGDAGSTFLGAILFGIAMNSNSPYQFISKLLLLSPIFLDAVSCIILRFINGYNIFKAHRMHLAQRLFLAGWSSSKVSLVYSFATAIMCTLYLRTNLFYMILFFIFLFIVGIVLDKNFAKPFPMKSIFN